LILEENGNLEERIEGKLDAIWDKLSGLSVLCERALVSLDWLDRRTSKLEVDTHDPSKCPVQTGIEGVKRDQASLSRTVGWIMGLIATVITGTAVYFVTQLVR